MRRTKIVCTLGPASVDSDIIEALVAAGMDCARLNFSHGEHENHALAAERVRAAADKAGRPLAILADLGGPKMRIGRFVEGAVHLDVRQKFTLTTEAVSGDKERVSVTYPHLPKDVKPHDCILLDDGLLRLQVEEVNGSDVVCRVIVGGTLSNNKGLNLPGVTISAPALSEKDRRDLAFAVDHLHVDYLALSFVRSAAEVVEAQSLAKGTPVIAKIEKPEALEQLSAILNAADGVMVARGDLGVELGPEKVPRVQKQIIREVNERGKVVITATQMLESMARNPRPTRAEAADVANAVIDGSDAVMLSGETASGSYPVETVKMMDAIVRDIEDGWLADEGSRIKEPTMTGEWGFANAAARAAGLMSFVLPLKALLTYTRDGRTGKLLSSYRPRAPILAVTPKERVARRLALAWGISPRLEEAPKDLEEALKLAAERVEREGFCKRGDAFALVVGWPPSSGTNTLKLHRL